MGNCGYNDKNLNENELNVHLNSQQTDINCVKEVSAARAAMGMSLNNALEREGNTDDLYKNESVEKINNNEPTTNEQVQELVEENKEKENLSYLKEMENLFDERIKNYGRISDIETMNSKTNPIVFEIEKKYKDFLGIEEIEKKIYDYDKEQLFYKGVVQFDDGSFYNGTWNSNLKKHGYGSFLKSDGSKYAGTFVEDEIEGEGYFIHTKGNIYKGQYKNEQACGFGEILHHEIDGYYYKGEFQNNKMHGNGIEKIPHDIVYEGEFNMGEKEPRGKISFNDGCSYEGDFLKSEINGFGTYKWKDGKVYVGEFTNNKINGKGKTTWPDGSYYEGEYKNNQRDGEGTLYTKEGEKYYIGSWLNNLYHGNGIHKDKNEEYKGIWRLGKIIKKY